MNSPVKVSTGPAQTAPASCVLRPFKHLIPLIGGLPELPAATDLANGDFEAGLSAWQVSSTAAFKGIYASDDPQWVSALPSIAPRSGQSAIWFRSCSGLSENASVYQRVLVPADARYLTFYALTISRESLVSGACPENDVARVMIDGVVVDTRNLCETLDNTGNPVQLGWQRTSIDLSTYVGRGVSLRFAFEADEQDGSYLLIDDVAFSATP